MRINTSLALFLFSFFLFAFAGKQSRTWTLPQLKKAVKTSTCISQVLKKLGLRHEGGNYAQMIKYIQEYELDTSHFTKHLRSSVTWTNDQFIEIVKSSRSFRQVLHALGLRENGSNYQKVKNQIIELNLDISHFTGSGWSRGLKLASKQPVERLLKKNSNYQTYKLKLLLFAENLKPKHCEQCGWAQYSKDGRLPLELDHINGDRHDHRLENLRILCPNCHALTLTHRACNYRRYTKVLTMS